MALNIRTRIPDSYMKIKLAPLIYKDDRRMRPYVKRMCVNNNMTDVI